VGIKEKCNVEGNQIPASLELNFWNARYGDRKRRGAGLVDLERGVGMTFIENNLEKANPGHDYNFFPGIPVRMSHDPVKGGGSIPQKPHSKG